MSIGSTIKYLHREKDITLEQLAEYLGITSRVISQQECFSPLLETQNQGISPLWTPRIFSSQMVPKL